MYDFKKSPRTPQVFYWWPVWLPLVYEVILLEYMHRIGILSFYYAGAKFKIFSTSYFFKTGILQTRM